MAGGVAYARQHAVLDGVLFDPVLRGRAIADLRRYFAIDGRPGELFTGRRFEVFAGGGDAEGVRNVVTGDDVLAISLLSVERGLGRLAIDVLETHRAEISALLAEVPMIPIYEVSEADYSKVLGTGSPAWRLWDRLRRCGGDNRWVAANKLLARKRPHLLPVYDRVVREELFAPASVWACLWTWFYGRPDRVRAVRELRQDVGGIGHVSLLRCLDAALWMRGRHRAVRTPAVTVDEEGTYR